MGKLWYNPSQDLTINGEGAATPTSELDNTKQQYSLN